MKAKDIRLIINKLQAGVIIRDLLSQIALFAVNCAAYNGYNKIRLCQ
ncbi:hypothetical protein [Xylanibacter caecicola]|nr:hypothetical protein [Xylanibacter caecicola]